MSNEPPQSLKCGYAGITAVAPWATCQYRVRPFPTWFLVVVTLILLHVPPGLVFVGCAVVFFFMVLRWIGRYFHMNGPRLYAAWGRAVRFAFPVPFHKHPIGTFEQQQNAERYAWIILIIDGSVLTTLAAFVLLAWLHV
jgi:hypothetical protein